MEQAMKTPVQHNQNHHLRLNGLSRNESNITLPKTEHMMKNMRIGSKRMYCERVIIPTSSGESIVSDSEEQTFENIPKVMISAAKAAEVIE